VIAIIIAVAAVLVVGLSLLLVLRTRSARRVRPTTKTPPNKGVSPPGTPKAKAAPPSKPKTAAKPTSKSATKPKAPPKPAAKPQPAVKPQPAPASAPEPVAQPDVEPAPPSVLASEPAVGPVNYRSRLGGVRGLFSGAVSALRSGKIDAATWDSLEEALIRADVGVATTDALLAGLRRRVEAKEIGGGTDLLSALGDEIRALLVTAASRDLRFDGIPDHPDVWLVVGVNGVGKTTTIGKLARQQVAAGRTPLLAAGDTFRAAAAEQLGMWGERSGVEVVAGAEGGDPSAIVFDAVQRAAARGNDLVLADTAGRLHNKVNLVEELKKIRRVAGRDPGNVTEVLLVLDATTGQNALAQARQFTEAVTVTGIVLTKLDGTAKGGIVIAVQRELGLPVKLVGLGEGPDDLVAFDPDEFVAALLDG
jgi:fused signal recognition particle receptor